jgi:hypothetical protein
MCEIGKERRNSNVEQHYARTVFTHRRDDVSWCVLFNSRQSSAWDCTVLSPQIFVRAAVCRRTVLCFIPQNYFHEKSKNGLIPGKPCCRAFNNFSYSRLIMILPVVLHGCETWPFALREGRRLRALRRVLRSQVSEETGSNRRLVKNTS